MRLADLAAALDLTVPTGADGDVEVTGVTHQADWVRPGDAFVAIPGSRFDGHSFIDRPSRPGPSPCSARACRTERPARCRTCVVPRRARPALADAATALAGRPSDRPDGS